MRNAGSTRFVRNNRLKSRLEGRQVYSRLRAFHAQFPEVQAKNELSRTVPVRNARERPERRYREALTANAAKVWQHICRDMRAERGMGPLKRDHPSLFTPFIGPEIADFCPVAWSLRLEELQCEWTMLAPNEAVIRHGQTMARAIHAGRVVHARICFRKTENRTDYSATILEEDGDLWNQVQRHIAIYRS